MSEHTQGPGGAGTEAQHGPRPGEKLHIWDKPENVKRFLTLFWVICAVLFVADFFVERYQEHPLESIKTIYAVYGFVGIALLIVLAKLLRKVVMRSEDYYDAD